MNELPPQPPALALPVSPATPEVPIGKIVDPASRSSGLLKQPSSADLAAFAPPRPLPTLPTADTAVDTAAEMPATLPGSAPGMPMYASGDALRGLGMALQPDTSGRTEVLDVPPAAPKPKAFRELGERTQAELMAGWRAKNPGKEFPADWVEPVCAPPVGSHDPNAPRSEPEYDAVVEVDKKQVKVSQRTLDEMGAGKARVEAIKVENKRIKDLVARQNAAAVASARPAQADDMDYVEGR